MRVLDGTPNGRCGWGLLLACVTILVGPTVANAEDIRHVVAGARERIERHRKRDVRVSFAMPDGATAPKGSLVRIQLRRHAFLFGGMIGGFGNANNATEEAAYRSRFADVMNYATLLYIWEYYEPDKNVTEHERWQTIARWCLDRGIETNGHSLMWNMEPQWLRRLSPDQAEGRMWDRIPTEVNRFRGLVDRWLVVNEATEGLYHAKAKSARTLLRAYQENGIPRTVARAYRLARGANPRARLILNDYEVTEKYVQTIQRCLDAGAEIDVIGLQSHMHQGYWGAQKIWDVCNRFAPFGKPLHFTELTLLSGRLMAKDDNDWSTDRDDWKTTARREQTQAAQVREVYHLLFSHPAVEAITWWDLTDRYAWMGAPGGLLRDDFSPKPAYYVVRDLVKKTWTTNVQGTLDDAGRLALRGFFGEYDAQITVEGHVYSGRFSIEKTGPADLPVNVK